jgi:four helix bundle protein
MAEQDEQGRAPRTQLKGKRKIRDYRDLRVWRKARKLADQFQQSIRTFPSAQARLAGRISRLADEVPAEIATGQGQRQTAGYLAHLERARGALGHLERGLIDAHKNGCLAPETGDPLLAQSAEIDRMLKKLMVSLELANARRRADQGARSRPASLTRSIDSADVR